jgi:uncharacterized protein YukE
MGTTILEVLSRLFNVGKNIFDMIPEKVRMVIVALGALFAAIKSGPIGMFIAAMTMLILLLDDFFTWQRGGKSHFAKQWEQLANLGDKLKKKFGPPLESLGQTIERISKKFSDLRNRGLKPFFDKIDEWVKKIDPFQKALDLIEKTADNIATAFGNIVNAVNSFVDLIEGKKNIFDFFSDELYAGKGIQGLLSGSVFTPYGLGDAMNYIQSEGMKWINSTFSSKEKSQASGYGGHSFSVGDINVNVTNTNATATEIGNAVANSILSLRGSYSPFLG